MSKDCGRVTSVNFSIRIALNDRKKLIPLLKRNRDYNFHSYSYAKLSFKYKRDINIFTGSVLQKLQDSHTVNFPATELERDDLGMHDAGESIENHSDEPPSTFLVEALTPTEIAEDFITNLEDLYPRWSARHGHSRAKWIFKLQCVRFVVQHWFDALISRAERLRKVIW